LLYRKALHARRRAPGRRAPVLPLSLLSVPFGLHFARCDRCAVRAGVLLFVRLIVFVAVRSRPGARPRVGVLLRAVGGREGGLDGAGGDGGGVVIVAGRGVGLRVGGALVRRGGVAGRVGRAGGGRVRLGPPLCLCRPLRLFLGLLLGLRRSVGGREGGLDRVGGDDGGAVGVVLGVVLGVLLGGVGGGGRAVGRVVRRSGVPGRAARGLGLLAARFPGLPGPVGGLDGRLDGLGGDDGRAVGVFRVAGGDGGLQLGGVVSRGGVVGRGARAGGGRVRLRRVRLGPLRCLLLRLLLRLLLGLLPGLRGQVGGREGGLDRVARDR